MPAPVLGHPRGAEGTKRGRRVLTAFSGLKKRGRIPLHALRLSFPSGPAAHEGQPSYLSIIKNL